MLPAGADGTTGGDAARLNRAENAIWHILRGREDFDPTVCRTTGTAARTMALAAMAAAYNIRLARYWKAETAETAR